jgi:hypothetical protein
MASDERYCNEQEISIINTRASSDASSSLDSEEDLVLQVRALRGRALAPQSYLTAVVGERLAVSRAADSTDPVWNEDFEPFVLHPGDRKLEVRVCGSDAAPQATFSVPLQGLGVGKVVQFTHPVGEAGEVEFEARLLPLDSDTVIVERTAGVASAGSILMSMFFLL